MGLIRVEIPYTATNNAFTAKARGEGELGALVADVSSTVSVTGEADDETFTTTTAHNLRVGETVYLTITTGGTGATSGSKTVATIPSSTTFTLSGVAYTADITAGSIDLGRVSTIAKALRALEAAFQGDLTQYPVIITPTQPSTYRAL